MLTIESTTQMKDMVWILNTPFGLLNFLLIFITWGLVIVNLCLSALIMVRVLFGEHGKLTRQKPKATPKKKA